MQIASEFVSPLSLALHELATNAVKYGAFSTGKGHVTISWATDEAEGVTTMTWLESDGPEVKPSSRESGSNPAQQAMFAAVYPDYAD